MTRNSLELVQYYLFSLASAARSGLQFFVDWVYRLAFIEWLVCESELCCVFIKYIIFILEALIVGICMSASGRSVSVSEYMITLFRFHRNCCVQKSIRD